LSGWQKIFISSESEYEKASQKSILAEEITKMLRKMANERRPQMTQKAKKSTQGVDF